MSDKIQKSTLEQPFPLNTLKARGLEFGRPDFSVLGDFVLFQARRFSEGNHHQLYLYDFKNHKSKLLFNTVGEHFDPVFSGNADSVLYVSSQDAAEKYFQFKKRSQIRRLNTSLYEYNFKKNTFVLLKESSGSIESPVVYPGSDYVIFSERHRTDFDLYYLNTKTLEKTMLYQNAGDDRGARVSPNGKRIVWQQELSSYKSKSFLLTANISSSSGQGLKLTSVKTVTEADSYVGLAAWTRDSKYLLYSMLDKESSKFSIYIADEKGRCRKKLVHNEANNIHPLLHPKQDLLLWASDRAGQGYDLYAAPVTAKMLSCQ